MPSWIRVFPELDGTTLTDVHAWSAGYGLKEDYFKYSLMMGFRKLTTMWTIFSFFMKLGDFSKLESQISITRTEAGEKNRDAYQGEEVLKLTLIKEAWQMAAKLRADIRNST